MNDKDKRKWDALHARSEARSRAPAKVLREHSHLLPATGEALELACGEGANAILLAERGLMTSAWDISEVATQKLTNTAKDLGVSMAVAQRDVVASPPAPGSFDVIVISRFLDRTIVADIHAALRERGLLFYQTFILEKVSDFGPNNPDYRLGENELLQLFSQLHILYYHEEGAVGEIDEGLRDEAMLIAQRRG